MLHLLDAFLPPTAVASPEAQEDNSEDEWIIHRAAIADRERAEAFLSAWEDAKRCVRGDHERRFPDGWVPAMIPDLPLSQASTALDALGLFVPSAPTQRTNLGLNPGVIEEFGAEPLGGFWKKYGPSMLHECACWTTSATEAELQAAVDGLASHIDGSGAPDGEDWIRPTTRAALSHLRSLLAAAKDGDVELCSVPWSEFRRFQTTDRMKRLIELNGWSMINEEYRRVEGLCEYMARDSSVRLVEAYESVLADPVVEPKLTTEVLLAACFDGLERQPMGFGASRTTEKYGALIPQTPHNHLGPFNVLIGDDLKEYASGIAALRPADLAGFGLGHARLNSLLERYRQLAADGGALIVDSFLDWFEP